MSLTTVTLGEKCFERAAAWELGRRSGERVRVSAGAARAGAAGRKLHEAGGGGPDCAGESADAAGGRGGAERRDVADL